MRARVLAMGSNYPFSYSFLKYLLSQSVKYWSTCVRRLLNEKTSREGVDINFQVFLLTYAKFDRCSRICISTSLTVSDSVMWLK